jgi:hypothetical protein
VVTPITAFHERHHHHEQATTRIVRFSPRVTVWRMQNMSSMSEDKIKSCWFYRKLMENHISNDRDKRYGIHASMNQSKGSIYCTELAFPKRKGMPVGLMTTN